MKKNKILILLIALFQILNLQAADRSRGLTQKKSKVSVAGPFVAAVFDFVNPDDEGKKFIEALGEIFDEKEKEYYKQNNSILIIWGDPQKSANIQQKESIVDFIKFFLDGKCKLKWHDLKVIINLYTNKDLPFLEATFSN